MATTAQWRGWCREGAHAIEPGDAIESSDDGGWQHPACAPVQTKPAEVCTTCFIEKPCECDDA